QPVRYIDESKALGKWFDVYAFPLGDPGSNTMAVFFTDITEQKRGEQEIRESEERFRKLADDSPMFVFIIDADPQAPVRYWNKTWLQYTGQSLDEAIGRAWNGILHPDDIAVVMTHYGPAFENRTSYLIPAVRVMGKDGAYRWHAFKGNPRYNSTDEFDGFVGVGFDIHEQKIAEEALQESEARSRLAIESARLGTYDIDIAKETILYSPRTAEIFGFDAGTQVPYHAFKDAIYPEDKPIRERAHQQAATTGALLYEVRIKTANQSVTWIRLNGKFQLKGGERRSLVGTVMDITEERKAAELLEQRIEERTGELKQVNDQLKQFSYSASHDLQEPLRKISFFLNTLVTNIGPTLGEENKKIVDRIQHTTGRMRSLIDDLLAYSNTTLGITGFQEVDLREVVSGVLDDMEAIVLAQGASIHVADLPALPGDERQLRQLFQNLVSNALKYQKKDIAAQVHITCSRVEGANIHPDISQTIRHETFHEIRVQDNGIGFDPDDAEKIFRIFHRLHGKGEYEGTGVGLAIVQKVVENHKGYIWAESSPGAGATFIVLLPVRQ
ncbi:MAG TPA: PAS domain S-box protein, partial [Flavisolibacter sp.]